MAVELLLLPRGATAAGLPLGVLRPCTRRRRPRAGRSLPGVLVGLDQPCLEPARGRPVPQRPRDRRDRARVRGRRLAPGERVPERARVERVRRAPPRPSVTEAGGSPFYEQGGGPCPD